MSEITRDEMDRWIITAMSHMKTMYEDHGIPWCEEDEKIFQAIRSLIENQPRVTIETVKVIMGKIIDLQKETELSSVNHELLYFIQWLKSIGVEVEKEASGE